MIRRPLARRELRPSHRPLQFGLHTAHLVAQQRDLPLRDVERMCRAVPALLRRPLP